MNLTKSLADKKAASKANIPSEKLAIMESATNNLKTQDLSNKSIKKGDILLNFNLPNAKNEEVSLSDFENDFLVVSFYRGGWCPYCNLELQALQSILPQLKKLNANLVAITPETPDNSLTTSEKNELEFNVLSDIDNNYAKSLGLAFELPTDLNDLYLSFNINLEKSNGNQSNELPMPATYVINKQREIIYSFISEDYTERLDPQVILNVLDKESVA